MKKEGFKAKYTKKQTNNKAEPKETWRELGSLFVVALRLAPLYRRSIAFQTRMN